MFNRITTLALAAISTQAMKLESLSQAKQTFTADPVYADTTPFYEAPPVYAQTAPVYEATPANELISMALPMDAATPYYAQRHLAQVEAD